jgi:hypothetical protein
MQLSVKVHACKPSTHRLRQEDGNSKDCGLQSNMLEEKRREKRKKQRKEGGKRKKDAGNFLLF